MNWSTLVKTILLTPLALLAGGALVVGVLLVFAYLWWLLAFGAVIGGVGYEVYGWLENRREDL